VFSKRFGEETAKEQASEGKALPNDSVISTIPTAPVQIAGPLG
jgi:hypothetical protein